MQSTNIGSRLREERDRLGLSQTAFGEAGGVKKFAQSNYENGKRHPDSLYLEKVSRIGVDIQYVVTGIRSSYSASSEGHGAFRIADGAPLAASAAPGPGLAPIKLYDVEGAAGAGRSLDGEAVESVLYFETAQLEAMGLPPGQVAGVKVSGDSMDGTLADKDWALVDLSQREPRPEGVFLLLVDGERRIKRVQRVAGGGWLLISDNTHYPPELLKPQDLAKVKVLGRCVIRIGKIF